MEEAKNGANLKSLQAAIGYQFKDEGLLLEALTHASYAYESRERDIRDNGRLEFLGDSILGIVVSEHLYMKNPSGDEGELTRLRSLIVSGTSLCKKALELNLPDYLRLGRGEEKTGGRRNATNLAGAFEAIMAAIYLDGGFDEASFFIRRTIIDR